MNNIALTNGLIILPDRIITGKNLLIKAGKIYEISDTTPTNDYKIIDTKNQFISPGFIDIHIHGAQGQSFNDNTQQAFNNIARICAQNGTTSILATLLTDEITTMTSALKLSKTLVNKKIPKQATILGMHVEGPFFAQSQKGAQDERHLLKPEKKHIDKILEHHEVIKIMSYAPELPGAINLTKNLVELGITAAVGHSDATDQDLFQHIDQGLSHVIHLWSAQSLTKRKGPWRIPGLLETALALDELTAELIVDNKHIPQTLMKLAFKCKGADRLCTISDASPGAGLKNGEHYTMGKLTYKISQGVGMTLDETSFGGSTTLQIDMLPILINTVGLTIPEAIHSLTLTPAKIIGADKTKGILKKGMDADIVIFNQKFSIWKTLISGVLT